MKALLPPFCRPMGYVILIISLFLPFLFVMWGVINDDNLLFYKETTKLLIMFGALLILLALTKNETTETERLRIQAIRDAVFISISVIFIAMLYRVASGDIGSANTSSFITFLIINVLCLEYRMKKSVIGKIFQK